MPAIRIDLVLGGKETVQADVTNVIRTLDSSIQTGAQKIVESIATELEKLTGLVGGLSEAFKSFSTSSLSLDKLKTMLQQIGSETKRVGDDAKSSAISLQDMERSMVNLHKVGQTTRFDKEGKPTGETYRYAAGGSSGTIRESNGKVTGASLSVTQQGLFDAANDRIKTYLQEQQAQLLSSSVGSITNKGTTQMRETFQLIDGRIATYIHDQERAIATLRIGNAAKPTSSDSDALSPERALLAEINRTVEKARYANLESNQQSQLEAAAAAKRERIFGHANRFAAMGSPEPGFLDELKSHFGALKSGIGEVGDVLGGVMSKMRALGRMSIYFSAMIYSAENLGRMLETAVVTPLEKISTATSNSRLFQLSISGVTGGANAAAIDLGIARNLNNTPFSLADTRQMVTDLTHIGPIAQQLSMSSPAQAQSLVGGYQNTIAGLQAMNPQSTTAEIMRGIEGALLGQGRGLRTVVQIDPDQLAQMVGRGNQTAFRGNPQLLMSALNQYVGAFGPTNLGGLADTPQVQIQHISDQISIALQQIGNSGVFDHILGKLKSFANELAAYFDPTNAPWAAQMRAMGDTATHLFDGLTDVMTAFVAGLSGSNSPANSVAEMAKQLNDIGVAAASFMKHVGAPVAGYVGERVRAIAEIPNTQDNLRWMAKGYTDSGPYGPATPFHPELHRSMLPPGRTTSTAIDPTTGLDLGTTDGVQGLLRFGYANAGNLSGGYNPDKSDAVSIMRANAMRQLKFLGDKGFLREPSAEDLANPVTGPLYRNFLPSVRQRIAEEALMEARGSKGRASADAYGNLFSGSTPLALQARQLGLSGINGSLLSMLPIDAQPGALDAGVKARLDMVKQYGGLVTPGMSGDAMARQMMLPKTSTFGASQTGNEISVYADGLSHAREMLANLNDQTGNMTHANADETQAFGQLSESVAVYSAKIAELSAQNNEAMQTFVHLGDTAEKTLAGGIGKYLTDIELHAKNAQQALRDMGKALLSEFNGSMMNLLMSTASSGLSSALGMNNSTTGAKTGIGQIFGGLFGSVGQSAGTGVMGYLGSATNNFSLSPEFWGMPKTPGVMNVPIDVAANADGGVYNSPALGLIGERGPEAVVPLNRSFISVGYDGSHAVLPGGARIPVRAAADGGVFGAMGLRMSGAGSATPYGPNGQSSQQEVHVHNYNLFDRNELAAYGYHATKGAILNDVAREAKPGGKLHRAMGHK